MELIGGDHHTLLVVLLLLLYKYYMGQTTRGHAWSICIVVFERTTGELDINIMAGIVPQRTGMYVNMQEIREP